MRYVTYLRYSTDMQKDTSIEDQRALCDKYAAQAGWLKINDYADRALHGTSMLKRKSLMEMLDDAQVGKFDVIVVEHLDRLGRRLADLHHMYDCLGHDGVKIFSLADNDFIDLLRLIMRGFQSAQFSTDLGKKCRRGQSGSFSRGGFLGSPAYGFTQAHGTRSVNEKEKATVIRIYTEFDDGVPAADIIRSLNADGVRTRRGKLWSDAQLFGNKKYSSGLLRNPIYVGQLRWGVRTGSVDPRSGNRVCKTAPAQDVQVRHVPELQLIDDATWQRVQERLGRAAIPRLDRRRLGRHLLSGKTVCGLCEQGYIRRTTKPILICSGHYHKRACRNRIRVRCHELEQHVLAALQTKLLESSVVDASVREYCEEHNRLLSQTATNAESLKRRKGGLERELSRLMDAIKGGTEESNASHFIRSEMEALLTERENIQKELEFTGRALPTLDPVEVRKRLRDQLARLGEAIQQNCAEASIAKSMIRALVDRIIITPLGDPSDSETECQLSVEIQGELGRLLSLAAEGSNKCILTSLSSWRRQYTPVGKWVVTVSVMEPRPARLARLKSDCSRILRLLFLDKPLTVQHLSIQIACSDRTPSKERATKQRVQRALSELAARGRVISTPLIGNRALGWQLAGEANSMQLPPRSSVTDPSLRARATMQRAHIVRILSEARQPLTTRQVARGLLGPTREGTDHQEFLKAVQSTGYWLRTFRTEGLVKSVAANNRDLLWSLTNSPPK